MTDIIRKLTSRKLWFAIAGFAFGMFVALGGDPSEFERLVGTILSLGSGMTYIVAEAMVDVAREKAIEGTDSK